MTERTGAVLKIVLKKKTVVMMIPLLWVVLSEEVQLFESPQHS